jgi:DNA-binding SARP family transcriptional activator
MKPVNLEFFLLGIPKVQIRGLDIKLTRKSLALLAYLVLEGRTSREKMADLLWSGLGANNSSGNLRRELHRIRETPVRAYLETTGGVLQLTSFVSDIADLLNSGELLQGLQLEEALEFDTWLDLQRQNQKKLRLEAMRLKAAQLHESDLKAALKIRQEIIESEPLSDLDVQALIACLLEHGERGQAEQVFTDFQKRLAELGLTPDLETAQLLLAQSANSEGTALLLERVGRGSDALEFRLAAALEAEEVHDYDAALEHLAKALTFQKRIPKKFELHRKRTEYLYHLSRFEPLEAEVKALMLVATGDARLEGMALVIQAQFLYHQSQLPLALEAATKAIANPLLPPETLGIGHFLRGGCLLKMGRILEAEPHFRQALLRMSKGLILEQIQAHHGLALLELQRGQIEEARVLNQAALDLLQNTSDRTLRPGILNMTAVISMMDGENLKALDLLEMSKRECEHTHNNHQLLMCLINISKAHHELGDHAAFTEALEQALITARIIGHKLQEGIVLNNLAVSYFERGDLGVALETGLAAIESAKEVGDTRGLAFRELAQIDILVQLGDLSTAIERLSSAKAIIAETNLGELEGYLIIQEATILRVQGLYQQALDLVSVNQEHPNHEFRLSSLFEIATCLMLQKKPVPKAILNTLTADSKWKLKTLPLQLRLDPTPELCAIAKANLSKVTALEQLELRLLLNEPHLELQKKLLASLETYQDLQQSFLARLEAQFKVF